MFINKIIHTLKKAQKLVALLKGKLPNENNIKYIDQMIDELSQILNKLRTNYNYISSKTLYPNPTFTGGSYLYDELLKLLAILIELFEKLPKTESTLSANFLFKFNKDSIASAIKGIQILIYNFEKSKLQYIDDVKTQKEIDEFQKEVQEFEHSFNQLSIRPRKKSTMIEKNGGHKSIKKQVKPPVKKPNPTTKIPTPKKKITKT